MIPIPIRDINRTRRTPVVTWALIAVNVLAFLLELVHGVDASVLDYGAIPSWVLHGVHEGPLVLGDQRVYLIQEVPYWLTPLTAMFLHGGWLHIIGNMWFLWIFGDNVEDAMGRGRYLAFYLLCGAVASTAHILIFRDSALPMVGASGAIAGILGAYAMLFPRAKIRCLWILIIFVTFIDLPAWLLLGLWVVSQFFLPTASGIAWTAHVAGFITGFLLVRLFASRPPPTVTPRIVRILEDPATGRRYYSE